MKLTIHHCVDFRIEIVSSFTSILPTKVKLSLSTPRRHTVVVIQIHSFLTLELDDGGERSMSHPGFGEDKISYPYWHLNSRPSSQ